MNQSLVHSMNDFIGKPGLSIVFEDSANPAHLVDALPLGTVAWRIQDIKSRIAPQHLR